MAIIIIVTTVSLLFGCEEPWTDQFTLEDSGVQEDSGTQEDSGIQDECLNTCFTSPDYRYIDETDRPPCEFDRWDDFILYSPNDLLQYTFVKCSNDFIECIEECSSTNEAQIIINLYEELNVQFEVASLPENRYMFYYPTEQLWFIEEYAPVDICNKLNSNNDVINYYSEYLNCN